MYADERELRLILDRLVDDPTERERLGARGEAYYRTHCTPEAHLDRYLAIIADLMTDGPGSETEAPPRSIREA